MSALGRKAYKAIKRGNSDGRAKRAPRPDAPLIWGVAESDTEARALLYLEERLAQSDRPCRMLVTSAAPMPNAVAAAPLCDLLPAETATEIAAFLDHWQPDLGLWLSGHLHPVLLQASAKRNVPLVLHGATESQTKPNLWHWLPGRARDALSHFDQISAQSHEAARQVRKLSRRRREVPLTSPLQVASPVPSVNQPQLDELNDMLAGRPVWLAAHVRSDELSDILEAHRATLRLTHRLLLVLVCAEDTDSNAVRNRLEQDAWRFCDWDAGDLIDEATQVVLAESPHEMGLWYRAAPVCFLGSSIGQGHGGSDPYVAAALGSAIIYGPNVGAHLSSYSRLAAAGAARIVRDASGLTRALTHLLAADQAASMAHAAWHITSEGAETTDRLVDVIQDLLDTALRRA